jgi:diguanylate cyclase (GGDEF)-like protein
MPVKTDAPLRVLVVENDGISRRALAKAVTMLGYSCVTACDGVEALEIHHSHRCDVVLSDWRMPRMDGIELCRRIRNADDESNYTYVILLSGYDDKEHFVRGMEAGADDYHTKPVDLDELRARLVSARRVIGLYRTLADKNARLRRDSERSFSFARIDPLTQVANRLRLNEDLRSIWARAKRYDHAFCAALVDLDDFKRYNDRHGHLAGDDLLRRIAQTMSRQLRGGDTLYRYGGDEFLVILPEQALSAAAQAMERLRAAVEELETITVTIGISELGVADTDPEIWLRRADAALYRAKARGRNRVEINSDVTQIPSETRV